MSLRVLHHWRGLAEADKGAALALGSFDGVHKGHQTVIADAADGRRKAGRAAGRDQLRAAPAHALPPRRAAVPADQPAPAGARRLDGLGVERLYLLPFGDGDGRASATATSSSEVLVGGLGVRHVAVGFDVTFGKGRTGDPELMRRYGEEFGFSVSVAEAAGDDGGKFSSTAARDALREGRPEQAAEVLGRPFAIEGVVQKGRQLGRKLGFPTANVPLGDYVAPKFGVYATRTRLKDGRELAGVANIGRQSDHRPGRRRGSRCGCSTSTRTSTARSSRPT